MFANDKRPTLFPNRQIAAPNRRYPRMGTVPEKINATLPVADGSNRSLAPLRKRMGGEIVVLVAMVVRDFKPDPVRQGNDGIFVL